MRMTTKAKRFIRGLAECRLLKMFGWLDTTDMIKKAILFICEKKTKEYFLSSVAINSNTQGYKKDQEKADAVWEVVSDYFRKVKRNPVTQEYYVNEPV